MTPNELPDHAGDEELSETTEAEREVQARALARRASLLSEDGLTAQIIAALLSERQRALGEAAKIYAWQPMDSAPRDGTEFLALAISDEDAGQTTMQQVIYWDASRTDTGYPWCINDGSSAYHERLFQWWQPLRTPPIASAIRSAS